MEWRKKNEAVMAAFCLLVALACGADCVGLGGSAARAEPVQADAGAVVSPVAPALESSVDSPTIASDGSNDAERWPAATPTEAVSGGAGQEEVTGQSLAQPTAEPSQAVPATSEGHVEAVPDTPKIDAVKKVGGRVSDPVEGVAAPPGAAADVPAADVSNAEHSDVERSVVDEKRHEAATPSHAKEPHRAPTEVDLQGNGEPRGTHSDGALDASATRNAGGGEHGVAAESGHDAQGTDDKAAEPEHAGRDAHEAPKDGEEAATDAGDDASANHGEADGAAGGTSHDAAKPAALPPAAQKGWLETLLPSVFGGGSAAPEPGHGEGKASEGAKPAHGEEKSAHGEDSTHEDASVPGHGAAESQGESHPAEPGSDPHEAAAVSSHDAPGASEHGAVSEGAHSAPDGEKKAEGGHVPAAPEPAKGWLESLLPSVFGGGSTSAEPVKADPHGKPAEGGGAGHGGSGEHSSAKKDAHGEPAADGHASSDEGDGHGKKDAHAQAEDHGKKDDHGKKEAHGKSDGHGKKDAHGVEAPVEEEVEEELPPPWPEKAAVDDALQPYNLVRQLRSVQDQVVAGSAPAYEMQKKLLHEIGEKMKALPPAVWKDARNVRAACYFVFTGGDPRVLYIIAGRPITPHVKARLVKAALAYGEGRAIDADALLASVNPRKLSPALGGVVALIKGTLSAKKDVKKALENYDEARLLSPGTLIEETALRQAILLLAREGDLQRYDLLSSQYARRFGKSLFSRNFRRQFFAGIAKNNFKGASEWISRADTELMRLPVKERGGMYLSIAEEAIKGGHVDIVRFAALKARELYPEGSRERERALLYEAAVLVAGAEFEQGSAMLAEIDDSKLAKADREILDVARVRASRLQHWPIPPATAAEDVTSVSVGRAEQLITLTDSLLDGGTN